MHVQSMAHSLSPGSAPAPDIINTLEESELSRLEQKLCDQAPLSQKARWLNDYLDLGLELACRAGERRLTRLQTSWVQRLYQTLRASALSHDAPLGWHSLCADYLYQPYFALVHLYRINPACSQQLRYLTHEFTLICQRCRQAGKENGRGPH